MNVERRSPWILALRSGGSARQRIFCFPYAGGGASVYRRWAHHAPDGMELCAVQLPGREDWLAEAPSTRLSTLVPVLAAELRGHFDLPFAFFGHSMGALIAFELTRELRRSQAPMPGHLFVSGRRAPHLEAHGRLMHTLPDGRFRAELRHLKGTAPAVLEDEELMELVTPILRADFALCETYACAALEPLDVGLSVFGGSDDPEASRDELIAWKEHSRQFKRLCIFPGNHFFVHEQAPAIMRAMTEDLRQTPILP